MGIINQLMGKKPKPREEELQPVKITKPKTYLQNKQLEKMKPYTILEQHEDGDITIETGDGFHWIICSDGRSFKEMRYKEY